MKKVALAVSVVSLAGFGMALSANAAGAATECNGTITGTISSGLVVHVGDNCDVESATVNGGVRMDGGTLNVCNSTINGGVTADVPAANSASASVNLGNIDFSGCAGNLINGAVKISGVAGTVPGDEQGSSVELETNTLNGTVTFTRNGLVEFESNHVNGSCKVNGPISNFINFDGPNTYTGNQGGCPG